MGKVIFLILKSKKGAGLTEIVISTLIIVLVSLAGLGLIPYQKQLMIQAGNIIQATSFSAETLESLSGLDYNNSELAVTPGAGFHTDGLPSSNLKDSHSGQRGYTVKEKNWAGTEISPGDYKEIAVMTSWNDGKDRQVSLITIMRRR